MEEEHILSLEEMDGKQLRKEILVRAFRGIVIAAMIAFFLSDLVYFFFRTPDDSVSEPIRAESIFWIYTIVLSPALMLLPLPRTSIRVLSIVIRSVRSLSMTVSFLIPYYVFIYYMNERYADLAHFENRMYLALSFSVFLFTALYLYSYRQVGKVIVPERKVQRRSSPEFGEGKGHRRLLRPRMVPWPEHGLRKGEESVQGIRRQGHLRFL